jgi:hypothetical protein
VVSAGAWRRTHTSDCGDKLKYLLEAGGGGGGGSSETLRRGCATREEAINGG